MLKAMGLAPGRASRVLSGAADVNIVEALEAGPRVQSSLRTNSGG